ncbi:phosphodiester glycosidase family protein [Prosthecobacter sp.]|uniref:phosphodiester glycosidase family protein n=1 Tax=Prosthecobacter sp. TaxID=1965333 RepID=UPI001E04E948|nr:phosphodiester glycosidase family protein [Prosthecobacter sp.]MCB1276889.1 phosphodiester glycosidase family protein [Prosthecobacter sp.]
MRRFVVIMALALVGCAQPPPPVATDNRPPDLAPRYPSWDEVPAPTQFPPTEANWHPLSPVEGQQLVGGASLTKVSVAHHGRSLDLQLIVFDSRSYDLKVIDQPEDWAGGGRIKDCMRRANAVAGVNGGFFTPQFTPMGLMIADGHKTGTWQPNKLLTGAVVVHRKPQLLWNAETRATDDASHFIQAGPRLVDAGRPVPKLERSKHVTRTFIATDGGHLWALGIAHSISLGELAEVLAASGTLPNFRIHRALNLDGGRSSAIYCRTAEGHEIVESGWSTVRNYLGIVPR